MTGEHHKHAQQSTKSSRAAPYVYHPRKAEQPKPEQRRNARADKSVKGADFSCLAQKNREKVVGIAPAPGQPFAGNFIQPAGQVKGEHGDDHVLVHLEAGGAFGDGRKPVAVFPEAFAFFFISGNDDVHVVLLFHNAHDVAHALVEQVGIVAIHLKDDDRNGRALVFLGLALVFDGLHVLGVEFFHAVGPFRKPLVEPCHRSFRRALCAGRDLGHQLLHAAPASRLLRARGGIHRLTSCRKRFCSEGVK